MKLIISDFFVSIILTFILYKIINHYFSSKIYNIILLISASTFILSSLALNLEKIIYSISIYLIGLCSLLIYIIIKINIKFSAENIPFWLLFLITTIFLYSIVITKKFIFNNFYNMGQTGDKGYLGNIGNSGESYFLKTYPQKLYEDLLNHCEEYLKKNKTINNILLYDNEHQIKNMYFKNLIKRVCNSTSILNYVYGKKQLYNECKYDDTSESRKCVITTGPCLNNTECPTSQSTTSEDTYNEMVSYLKYCCLELLKLILRNSSLEDDKVLEALNYNNDSINNLVYRGLIEEAKKYNSVIGHKFISDYFLTNTYFDEMLVKKVKLENPFCIIKNMKLLDDYNMLPISTDNKLQISTDNLDNNPFNFDNNICSNN